MPEVKNERSSVGVSGELWEKLNSYAERIPGMTASKLGSECIKAVLEMVETAENHRTEPQIVRVLDAVKEAAPKLLRKAKENLK